MKYIFTFLIFIGLSTSAFAEGQNTRWVLLSSFTWLPTDSPIVIVNQVRTTGEKDGTGLYKQKETFETESDCYTALKDDALISNKIRKEGGSKVKPYKIEIIDDIKITAQESNEFSITTLHCVEITLSR